MFKSKLLSTIFNVCMPCKLAYNVHQLNLKYLEASEISLHKLVLAVHLMYLSK